MNRGRPASSKRSAASGTRSRIPGRWKLRSVTARLTIWYVGTLAVSLGAFATFVLIVRVGALRREFDADLMSRVAIFAAEIKPLLDRMDAAKEIADQPNVPATPVTVRRGDGSLIYESPDVPHLTNEWERAAAQGAANHLTFQTVRDATRQEQRLVNRFITSPKGYPYVVQLMGPPVSIDENTRQLAASQALGILLILALATYGSALTARQALAPIDEIIRRGREIHGHDPGQRLEVEADTIELEQLVASMNAMLDRLEEPVHTAHRFAANVSHELQTPLAAMRFAIEAAQRSNRPAEKYQQIADDLLSEVDRLSTLVRDLRLLAIAGAGQLIGQPEPFDLGEVVQQCCEIARAVADSDNIAIDEQVLGGFIASGSALHLRRVILNLTDNAVRYSPQGSTVRVRMEWRHGIATIAVSDCGCGIRPEDRARIFEPFFRADRARARDTGGSGLGLAIADQIVRAHHGRITVESEPNAGSTFTIHVPAVAALAHSA
jgi:signal transduction histidine kinase